MDFDKTHLNILSIIKTFCSSLPDQLSRLCPPHFYLPILTFLDWIYIVWTFYSYGHFTLWTFSDSSNLYGHFITMDNLPYVFFTHRSFFIYFILKKLFLSNFRTRRLQSRTCSWISSVWWRTISTPCFPLGRFCVHILASNCLKNAKMFNYLFGKKKLSYFIVTI